MANFCSHCGKPVTSEMNFCANCGSKIVHNSGETKTQNNSAVKGAAIATGAAILANAAAESNNADGIATISKFFNFDEYGLEDLTGQKDVTNLIASVGEIFDEDLTEYAYDVVDGAADAIDGADLLDAADLFDDTSLEIVSGFLGF